MPTCKECIHFKICNDYEYLIGRENKVACPDFKSTEDVVPRSEVEELQKKLDEYEKFNVVPLSEAKEKINQAKQEVARKIFEDFTKHKVCTNEEDYRVLAELEKKYIGE